MTFRNPNTKTEQQGIRYVETVVQNNNCIIQKIDRDNDQGNDCFIEFVIAGIATNYNVFAQIKSGESYKDNRGYKIPANIDHIRYWYGGLNLNIGIVYDPIIKKAFWVDIKAYINLNPKILNQKTHEIRLNEENEFCEQNFDEFIKYCFLFKEQLTNIENYGRSLEWFADVEQPVKCYEGLKSLFANFRTKPSTWYYIISSFSNISDDGIRATILGLLGNYADNPNIFWHSKNIQFYPTDELKGIITSLMTKYFLHSEIELCLSYMEDGITKGSFSYLVYLVINFNKNADVVLQNIAFNSNLDADKRNFCFWLYMHIAKYKSKADVITSSELYFEKFAFGKEDEALIGLVEGIQNNDLLPIG